MSIRTLLIAVLPVMLFAVPSLASDPYIDDSPWKDDLKPMETFFVHAADTGINLPEAFEEGDTPFQIRISRKASDETEARLLRIAEAICAGTATMQAEAARRPMKDPARPEEGPMWWLGTFDDVRMPAFISPRAIRYYQGITDAFQKGNWVVSNHIAMSLSRLHYRAEIQKHAAFDYGEAAYEDVYVVRSRLQWTQYCGGECAMSASLEQAVVLKGDGTVVAVYWNPFGSVRVS